MGAEFPVFIKSENWYALQMFLLNRFVPDYEVVALAEVFNVSCENLLGLTDAPAK